ncbi:unnamed protein product [Pararhodospirillum photometricum DSM 122]|uniref:Uncharacterized protein n=1 Tax=Pararhodospirillum photometricum DSM 122 TaxID=1150469 RepID=H6SPW6_PARPM|nr:unnamed protein product [Pararhodospirillum photometricum DSM 122]
MGALEKASPNATPPPGKRLLGDHLLIDGLQFGLASVGKIAQLALHGIEGIAQGDTDIFVSLQLIALLPAIAARHQVLAGDGNEHTDQERLSPLVNVRRVLVVKFHNDARRRDVLVELLQLGKLFTNPLFDGVGVVDSVKDDLGGTLHGALPERGQQQRTPSAKTLL